MNNIFTLSADIKLLSLNQAFSTLPNGRRCKSPEYVKFSRLIAFEMRKHPEFLAFDNLFDRKKHQVNASLTVWTPDLYTKDGMISKNSGDLANLEKTLLDNVLTRNIDDSAIVLWWMSKLPSLDDKHRFRLKLELVERLIN